ncbi:DUF2528 family protein [Polaromonas naphthalenivorans]|uniref:DUF2528 family protein n=1 Tax=Polaromonas naphthalenivorans (strain CJ2) TaxID=365044 RepID=A1VSJ9_POLNA|nr:DUF2528 family protein [Polaromonas naphthalenivorans]ABM38627.1 hypothetical protein Pnap_3330 [Polaromonas naphthalenivorans CJ2]
MSMIKTFKVCAEYNDEMFVVLQVDMDKLTPALANEVNDFWGGEQDRLSSEDDDVVRAVIRLYGSRLIRMMLSDGGATFTATRAPEAAQAWTVEMQSQEGWPGTDDTPSGLIGIQVIEAQVEVPDYDGVELSDITAWRS